MRVSVSLLAMVAAAGSMLAAQGQTPPKPEETIATAIPGVIAAGTKVEVISS
jgi:hypothetical protein